MKSGTLIGIGAESTNQAVPLMRRFHDAGADIAGVIAVENPGLNTDAKKVSPSIPTIARWLNPNNKWERGHDVYNWPKSEREDFAAHSIQMVFDRTNDEEYASSDFFCPGINEPDPPEPNGAGYKALAEVMIMLCDEATRRSPEMVARGLHPIKLAIPGFNAGTPEFNEMQAVVATGLLDKMKARGDILMFHEGPGFGQPTWDGYGDLIPGAPSVPPGAGSLCGRLNYWYGLLGAKVPFAVTEFYDGNTRDTPPAQRVNAIIWYDKLLRHNPYALFFAPFEITDIVDGPWWRWDFTPAFQSPEMLAYMLAEKGKPNPTPQGGGIPPEVDMDATVKAEIAGHAQDILSLVWLDGKTYPFTLPAPNKVLTFRHADGSPFAPAITRNVTWTMTVKARSGTLLLVLDQAGTDNDWYVRASDVTPT
jgi:hypothetical protein